MKKRLWELGKDMILVALLCSLILLALSVLPVETVRQNHWLSRLLQPLAPVLGISQAELTYVEAATDAPDAAQPMMISVRSEAGRASVLWDFGALDEAFSLFGGLVGQAMDTAQELETAKAEEVRHALSGRSVLLQYGVSVPARVLASWLDAAPWEADTSLRSCALAIEGDQVLLYLLDGLKGVRAVTGLTPEALAPLLAQYRPDGSQLAFEAGSHLSPLTLIPAQSPSAPAGRVYNPITGRTLDQLATELGFNPYSETRYTDSAGTTHFSEPDCALRIEASGLITMTSSGERFRAGSEEPEALAELARELTAPLSGQDVRLYLSSFLRREDTTICTFDYVLAGVPVAVSRRHAAEVRFTGGAVTELTMLALDFQLQEKLLSPMPAAQAAAILPRGSTLTLQYEVGPEQTLALGWKG